MTTTTPARTNRSTRLPAGADETLTKLRERQEHELQAAAGVAQQLHIIRGAETTIEAAWTEIGTAIRDLATLGWNARQIADTLDLDHRRVTDLLREPTTAPDAEAPAPAPVPAPAAS